MDRAMQFWRKRAMYWGHVRLATASAIAKLRAEKWEAKVRKQFKERDMQMPPPNEAHHREHPRATKDRLKCGGFSMMEFLLG